MTQAAVQLPYHPRKRLADGPLASPHPSKHPRYMSTVTQAEVFVKAVFSPGPGSLPVYVTRSGDTLAKISPASKWTSHVQPHIAQKLTTMPILSHLSPPVVPESDSEEDIALNSQYYRKRSSFSAVREPPTAPLSDSGASTSKDPWNSRQRRHSIAESSRPGSTPLQLSYAHAKFDQGSQSIAHASRWVPLAGPSEVRSSHTHSSVASTSKSTLDSISTHSSSSFAPGRCSSGTSATSASSVPSSGFNSLTPHPKPTQTPPTNPLTNRPSLLFDSGPPSYDLPPPMRELSARDLRTPTHSTFSIDSTSSQESNVPKYVFNYASSEGFDETKLLYNPSKAPRRNPGAKGRKRLHIYEWKHKASLARRLSEIKEEVRHFLFLKARSQGYGGTEKDFKEYTNYAVSIRDAIEERPYGPRPDDEAWFINYISKYKKTINGPKQKIFSPTLDQLNRTVRAKDAAIDDRLRPPRPKLPHALPPEDDAFVDATLHKRGIIAKVAREQVADADIRRLHPRQWLNDEIINFYGAMIMTRAEEQKENIVPRGKILWAFYLSTFFWQKLTQDGYEKGRLAKWTKKVDIFTRDVILIPVNHGNAHWTAAAINFQKKRFESYDSMGMAKEGVWKACSDIWGQLREYVRAEHLNKKKKPFDFTGWTDWAPDDTPQQDNGFDCGVFTCQFLESLSRGEDDFVFTQEDMPYLRRRMVWEIANVRLRTDL